MMFAAEMNGFGPAGRYGGPRHYRDGHCGRGIWWIAAVVMGFILFWPIGLAILAFGAFTGRLGYWRNEMRGHWQAMQSGNGGGCGWGRRGGGRWTAPSGNQAFDDYRAETLRRLEEEQREFVDYLERLRRAKDKAEFDQFMAERRGAPRPPSPSENSPTRISVRGRGPGRNSGDPAGAA